MKTLKDIQNRKSDHIRINLEEDVLSGYTTGLENYALEHCALPEIDFDEIKADYNFLGFQLKAPLIISSMTGGVKEGETINRHLAEAAQYEGIALGLGSQRLMLENPELSISYDLRKYAPDIPIFGNIGAVQLNYDLGVEDCKRLVGAVGANALIIHLNPLQEALQPEGQKNFSGLLKKIEALRKAVEFPIIAKEVGWGISINTAKQLINAGISALDVAGAGGTSWSQVEANRILDEHQKRIAFDFRAWGIPTASSIIGVRSVNKNIPLIASGGIHNGIEVAKCIALGANLCGMAGQLLKAGTISSEEVIKELNAVFTELRIAMFASGSIDLASLSKSKITEIPTRFKYDERD